SDGEKTIVYTADTAYCEAWIDFDRKTELLVTDCNFYEGQDGSQAGHMTRAEGANIAAKAGDEALLLRHIPKYRNKADLVVEAGKYFSENILLAEEGLVWE